MLPQGPYRDASYRTEERVAHSYSVPDWPPGSRGDALARTFLPWCRSEADHGGVPTVSRFLLVLGPERCRSKERPGRVVLAPTWRHRGMPVRSWQSAMLGALCRLATEPAARRRFVRDVAQLGQRTCFGIISELALCYPASLQLVHDRKWSNKVRSCALS